MKKLIVLVVTALSALFIGCEKDLPSVEKMYALSHTAGMTAGYVANMTKISDKDKEIVIEIFNLVAECSPVEGQKFADVWIPVADKYINELIAAGKITKEQGVLITNAFSIAVKAIDYAVFNRYPKIGERVDLVAAASKGFTTGFLSVFKAACKDCEYLAGSSNFDKELYDYLTK